MIDTSPRPGSRVVIQRPGLQRLLDALSDQGYQIVGPTVRDGAIVYDNLTSVDDLPVGWTDEQEAGSYRLKKRGDEALFGYAVGPHSWKKLLHPPELRLWKASKNQNGKGFRIIPEDEQEEAPKFAFIAVRSCELNAIAIQDRVFTEGTFVDSTYLNRRDGVFTVAVNCGESGGTCFCQSMNSGPKATSGFDLALTEVLENGRHEFIVEIGTDSGGAMLDAVPYRIASAEDQDTAERIVASTARQMGRTMDTTDIQDLFYRNYENPLWDEVASRCLTCGNCTMVCPTCFCTTIEDVTDLTGEHAERWRKWDSCFTMDFSYIHGGSVRSTTKARFRQWMTHKLATWFDQFGTSGCVGCGRCITWCPVAIDITEEVATLRESELTDSSPGPNEETEN